MRVLVMFDMPTKTKSDRKATAKFRQTLLKEGYFMLQFSVYVRICKGIKSAHTHMERLRLFIPAKGHIRALMLTEKQFEHMQILVGDCSEVERVQSPTQITVL